jgi:hypothetical protein
VGLMLHPQPKPRAKLLDKRKAKADIAKVDRAERKKCRARSHGKCEVYELTQPFTWSRCLRPVSENHHLIGGIGRRNRGRSILAAHRLDICLRCHRDINGCVLVPVDGARKDDAATVRYERIR